ncbi:hypothetical protein DSM21852_25600 [Methylocystis bryophila]|nr:hypothetical protein DSM21852_25600 [Methylocystis bryophila]
MDGADLDAVRQQRPHHRIDLGFDQHEIAHHHSLKPPRLERDPAPKGEARLDADAVKYDVKIATRQAVSMDGSRHRGLFADRGIDL